MQDNSSVGSYALGLLSLMIVQQALVYLVEKTQVINLKIDQFHYLHESGLQILIGGIGGLLTHLWVPYHLTFSKDLFFYVLIPTYFFSAAYGMDHKYYSKYFFYINWFGILGTLFNVLMIFGFTYGINQLGWVIVGNQVFKLNNYETLAFALIMSSLDGVVGKNIVNHHYRPKLYSLLFGEEMLNDLTIYSLYISLINMQGDNNQLDEKWQNYFQLIGLALGQFLASITFGIFMGGLMTLFSKLFFDMFKSKIAVTTFVIYTAYFTHSLAKTFHLAGGVSIFFVGIIYSHYLQYNMPYRCFKSSKVTIQVMASMFEAFIFIYLGLTLCQTILDSYYGDEDQISWQFVFAELFAISISRIICYSGMVGLLFLTRLRNRKTLKLYIYDMIIICFSGLARGTISFALIQYLDISVDVNDPQNITRIKVIKSTVLLIIIISNILMTLAMVFIAKACFRRMKLLGVDEKKNTKSAEKLGQQRKLSSFGSMIYDCGTKTRVFSINVNEKYLKPFLIYDYKKRLNEIRNYQNDQIKPKLQIQTKPQELVLIIPKELTPIEQTKTIQLKKPQSDQQSSDLQATKQSQIQLQIQQPIPSNQQELETLQLSDKKAAIWEKKKLKKTKNELSTRNKYKLKETKSEGF